MSRLRLRRLKLHVETTGGIFSTEIPFEDGLVVLWADNSMGKSTCLRAILYAMGLEAMLTTNQQDPPVSPALKWKIEDNRGEHAVISSFVELAIEGRDDRSASITRSIKGGADHHLVSVIERRVGQDGERRADYFVSRPFAATSEQGFHSFLADFIGWELPTVTTFDGDAVLLYVQTIFPYLAVEQTRGWSSLTPPLPTQFRIRDAAKRVVEFLLQMDAQLLARKRSDLLNKLLEIDRRWEVLRKEVDLILSPISGKAQFLPTRPLPAWGEEGTKKVVIASNQEWVELSKLISSEESELVTLQGEELPRVEGVTSELSARLQAAEKDLRLKESLGTRLLDTLRAEEAEVSAVESRLAAIEEDLRKNRDVQILRSLGSQLTSVSSKGQCPTCHQPLQDTLSATDTTGLVMSVEENINFLTEQRRTFQGVLKGSREVVVARQRQLASLRRELNTLRQEIRSIRQTLVSDGRLPSIAAMEKKLRLEQRIRTLAAADDSINAIFSQLDDLFEEWNRVQGELKGMPKGDISEFDRAKLRTLQDRLIGQLEAYGFGSVPPSAIAISPDTYRPEHAGFDLQAGISASDLIRAIWAYLHGLLEVAREHKTNHPGLLIFDEPKQQSAREVSFGALFRRASSAATAKQQVIFATSEKLEVLKQLLLGVPHQYIEFSGRVLKPKG